MSGRRVAGAIRSLDNARDLQLECASFALTLLVPVLMYGNETMLWKEERSRIMTQRFARYYEDGQGSK